MESSIRKKLVIVGDGACGKTCLLIVFSRDEFPPGYIPTIFDTFVAEIEVNGKLVNPTCCLLCTYFNPDYCGQVCLYCMAIRTVYMLYSLILTK